MPQHIKSTNSFNGIACVNCKITSLLKTEKQTKQPVRCHSKFANLVLFFWGGGGGGVVAELKGSRDNLI